MHLRRSIDATTPLPHKVEREKIVLAALPELSLQIVEFAREHGRTTMGDAIRLTDGKRNTLKQHFRVLVERGHLAQHGAGRGVWYEFASSSDVPRSSQQEEEQGGRCWTTSSVSEAG
ncbi:hypothetical protein [Verminephrobacter aporrectodeae]|uniref:hypothetical protein n=1 Tax=Verminephrobacter aporrectodeae TaxID=1110389 RepID=UPI0022446108|nr:hypothetical protein [Verminephrobacter aporrectodeae]